MLEARYGVRIVRAKQAVTAGTAGEADASALDLKSDEPVLKICRTSYDSSNLVVEHALSAMRPGYPIETIMQRRPVPDLAMRLVSRDPRLPRAGPDPHA
jgi:hypothetical protein